MTALSAWWRRNFGHRQWLRWVGWVALGFVIYAIVRVVVP